jgi:Mat/Ecp fimbriae outer membrane usher protein
MRLWGIVIALALVALAAPAAGQQGRGTTVSAAPPPGFEDVTGAPPAPTGKPAAANGAKTTLKRDDEKPSTQPPSPIRVVEPPPGFEDFVSKDGAPAKRADDDDPGAEPETKEPPGDGPIRSAKPPPGFEAQPRRELLVDLMLGEHRLGQIVVFHENGRIKFKDPKKALALIEGLRRKDAVAKLFAAGMPSNAHLVCRRNIRPESQPGCGVLEPKIAGLILDEGRLRLYVFLHERHLDPASFGGRKYLGAPEAEPSLVAQFNGAVSGQIGGATRLDLRNSTVLAFKDMRLRADVSVSDGGRFRPDTLAFEWDQPGWRFRGGLLRGLGSRIVPELRIYGVGAATSTDLRVDLEQAFGSQLSLFLRRPAFVEVIRDGRVVSTRYYPAGNRVIDTSDLPSGAYGVTLRIREVGGETRDETRFFAKTEALPPKDQPVLFADAGVLAEDRKTGLPRASRVPIAKGGARVRVLDGLALGAEIAGTNREGVFEASVFYVSPLFRIQATGLVSSKKDWGAGIGLTAAYKEFSASANARYVRAARAPIAKPTAPESFRFVNESALQFSGSIAYAIEQARLGFSATWQQSFGAGAKTTYAIGPNVEVRLWRDERHTVYFNAEALKTERGYTAFARVTWRWQAAPAVIATSEAGVRGTRVNNSNNFRDVVRAEVNYQLPTFHEHEVALQPSFARDGTNTAGLDASVRGPYGRFHGSIRHAFDGAGADQTGYGATVSFGIALDRKGFAAGGANANEAGAILRVKGPASAGKFTVLVNGAPRLTLAAGETRPIFLAPYREYEIHLKPEAGNAALTHIAGQNRRLVLYPGTARTVEWNVAPVTVVFGRLVDDAGKPMANVELDGVVGAGETDARGYFQVEVNGGTTTLKAKDNGKTLCAVTLPGPGAGPGSGPGPRPPPGQEMLRLGTVKCAGG